VLGRHHDITNDQLPRATAQTSAGGRCTGRTWCLRPPETKYRYLQLTLFGVGATVGTGIFFVLSAAVPEAGPAVLISFVLAAVAAGLSAIC
jgi:hypothetical protein